MSSFPRLVSIGHGPLRQATSRPGDRDGRILPSSAYYSIEREFGIVDGRPSGIGEYTGRSGSFSGTSLGIEGISTSGPVAFSDFRGKTAHATPEQIIHTLYETFDTVDRKRADDITVTYRLSPYLVDTIDNKKYVAGTRILFPSVADYNSAVQSGADNFSGSRGIYAGQTAKFALARIDMKADGNVGGRETLVTNFLTQSFTDRPESEIDSEFGVTQLLPHRLRESRRNTIVFLATGKVGAIGSTDNIYQRINNFRVNGKLVTPQDASVAITLGMNHGAGNGGGKYNSWETNQTTCMAVYNTGPNLKLHEIKNAAFTAPSSFWSGPGDKNGGDALRQMFILLLPNRWTRISTTMHPVGGGRMTLGPNDIAIVTSAGPGSASGIVGFKRYWSNSLEVSVGGRLQIWVRRKTFATGTRQISDSEILSTYTEKQIRDSFGLKTITYTEQVGRRTVERTIDLTKIPIETALREFRTRATTLGYPVGPKILVEEPIIENLNGPSKLIWAPIVSSSGPLLSSSNLKFLPAMFFSVTECFGRTSLAVFGNYHNESTITCDLSTFNFAPCVSIFRFVGDGYMTSRSGVNAPFGFRPL